MIKKLIDGYCQFLSYLIAAALALMVLLVFGNVVMRYAFNSGFSVSEELSRWLFVWVTFLGAVVAVRDNGHLGTDMLVGRLGPAGKKVCMGLALLLMLFTCWLLFKGSYDQAVINWDTTSAVMEVSMSWFYASGMVFAVLASVIVLNDLWRLLSGQMADADLVLIQESEEAPHGDAGAAPQTH
ncbi:TRAP transporter small permease [Polaromonas sp.]|uniref:TRAP transporter small permease n=1 Tax=Polaromonas sp. TaxID=1869339 RepID=UPI00286CAF5E|nr:TRAP transporter small permease [Polaromonas sp.]